VFICGLTRPSTKEAATAASTALPPALSMSTPALTERFEFPATAPWRPRMRGWKVMPSVGAMRYARGEFGERVISVEYPMLLFELLAEQKIAEAVSRGELDGVPGQGRPLDLNESRPATTKKS
jgi:hypothetical protein